MENWARLLAEQVEDDRRSVNPDDANPVSEFEPVRGPKFAPDSDAAPLTMPGEEILRMREAALKIAEAANAGREVDGKDNPPGTVAAAPLLEVLETPPGTLHAPSAEIRAAIGIQDEPVPATVGQNSPPTPDSGKIQDPYQQEEQQNNRQPRTVRRPSRPNGKPVIAPLPPEASVRRDSGGGYKFIRNFVLMGFASLMAALGFIYGKCGSDKDPPNIDLPATSAPTPVAPLSGKKPLSNVYDPAGEDGKAISGAPNVPEKDWGKAAIKAAIANSGSVIIDGQVTDCRVDPKACQEQAERLSKIDGKGGVVVFEDGNARLAHCDEESETCKAEVIRRNQENGGWPEGRNPVSRLPEKPSRLPQAKPAPAPRSVPASRGKFRRPTRIQVP